MCEVVGNKWRLVNEQTLEILLACVQELMLWILRSYAAEINLFFDTFNAVLHCLIC